MYILSFKIYLNYAFMSNLYCPKGKNHSLQDKSSPIENCLTTLEKDHPPKKKKLQISISWKKLPFP